MYEYGRDIFFLFIFPQIFLLLLTLFFSLAYIATGGQDYGFKRLRPLGLAPLGPVQNTQCCCVFALLSIYQCVNKLALAAC